MLLNGNMIQTLSYSLFFFLNTLKVTNSKLNSKFPDGPCSIQRKSWKTCMYNLSNEIKPSHAPRSIYAKHCCETHQYYYVR